MNSILQDKNGKEKLHQILEHVLYNFHELEELKTEVTLFKKKSFKDVLFPYVRENLKTYLIENFDTSECQEDLQLLIEQVNLTLKMSRIDTVC